MLIIFQKKSHLVFEDATSVLRLSSATLDTNPTGLILSTGHLEVVGDCLIKIPDVVGAELDLYEEMDVDIKKDASLAVDGPVNYL